MRKLGRLSYLRGKENFPYIFWIECFNGIQLLPMYLSDIIYRIFPVLSSFTGFVTRLIRRMPVVDQELPTLLGHLSSPLGLIGVRITRSLVVCVCLVGRCLSFYISCFWSLCCLFFFNLRILIIPLVSSNCLCRFRPN